ncbi:MAG: HDOD domain-containing protein [Candidatus Latescibacteria bacterium]|nr:HDOD domain-containing protein [Candidatus Latescibacterota bacterium]
MNSPACKILIVNNEDEIRDRLAGILNQSGFSTYITDTGESAQKYLDKEPVGLVLYTINVENENEKEFIREIKVSNPEVAVIVLAKPETRLNSISLVQVGVDSFLPVNVDRNFLVSNITAVLEKHQITVGEHDIIKNLERSLENRTLEFDLCKKMREQNFSETIKAFVGLLDTRDRFLGSHLKRVATFSKAISERYDLKDRVKHEIEIAALLHDIGKIGIPDIILQKTQDYFALSRLTNKERDIVRKHPIIGQEAVEMIDVLKHIGIYIRHHHEHFDGSGYPDGLKGFYIPLGSRILRVADAYDRIVFGVEKVKQMSARELFLKHLKKYTGYLYDPEVVKYFLSFLKEMQKKESAREKRTSVDNLTPGMVLSRDVLTRGGVLLISQFETINENEIKRLKRFQRANLLIDGITIYESPKFLIPSPKRSVKKDGAEEEHHEEIGFDKVCKKIDDTKDLHTLPKVYHLALSLLSDPKSTRDDIVSVLKRDQVITTKILRIVNSSLFGFSRTITTIDDAIPLLGFNEIRNIVTSVSILKLMGDGTNHDIFDRQAFWKHSIGCAIVTKIVAKYIGISKNEEYFTAGLLHDIGKLVLDQLFPDEFRKLINLVNSQSIHYRKAEREIFGQPHQEIGAYLLTKWNIPGIIVDAVRFHHSPVDSAVDPFLVSAVHVGDIITHMLAIGDSGERNVPKLEDYAERQLGIGLVDLDQLVPDIDEQLQESEDLLVLGD